MDPAFGAALIAVGGVVVGSVLNYAASALAERRRDQEIAAQWWRGHKLDAYRDLLVAARTWTDPTANSEQLSFAAAKSLSQMVSATDLVSSPDADRSIGNFEMAALRRVLAEAAVTKLEDWADSPEANEAVKLSDAVRESVVSAYEVMVTAMREDLGAPQGQAAFTSRWNRSRRAERIAFANALTDAEERTLASIHR